MNDRISLILKYKNISATKFADEIDVQRSSISHILSERNKPSLEFIQKILKTYSEISPEWLISGKGAMIKNPDLFEQVETTTAKEVKPVFENDTFSKNINIPEEQPVSIVEEKIQNEVKPVINEEIKAFPSVPNNKKIEKILVFYTDNTFKEYFPQD